ncbi:MAG: hypothetical protein IKU29_02905 [Parabacteroides sp.]|nr:hypothetical protein [Parabacteroides sp.]
MKHILDAIGEYVETDEYIELYQDICERFDTPGEIIKIAEENELEIDELKARVIFILSEAIYQCKMDYLSYTDEQYDVVYIALGFIWNRYLSNVFYHWDGTPDDTMISDVTEDMSYLIHSEWLADIEPGAYGRYLQDLNKNLSNYGYMIRKGVHYEPEYKPKSFDEIIDKKLTVLDSVDLKERAVSKGLDENSEWEAFNLCERVGFDHVIFNVRPDSIDTEKLLKVIREECIEDEKDSKVYHSDAKTAEKSVLLPWEEHKYSRIKIELSKQIKFLFRKSTENHSQEERKEDVYQLEVFVKPCDELFGNVQNYSIENLQQVVKDALDKLYETCGIYIRYNSVRLFAAELNVTMMENDNTIPDIMWLLRWMKTFQAMEFEKSTYSVTEAKVAKYKKREIPYHKETDVTMKMETPRRDMKIILYDKGRKLVEDANKQLRKDGANERLILRDDLLRLEFGLKGEDLLLKYFDSIILSKITEEDIYGAWFALVAEFLEAPYKRYVDESEKHVKCFMESLTKEDWKDQVTAYVMEMQREIGTTPYMLDFDSFGAALKYNSIFGDSNNRKHYRRTLKKIFQDKGILRQNEKSHYKVFSEFIDKIKRDINDVETVEVGYIVSEK